MAAEKETLMSLVSDPHENRIEKLEEGVSQIKTDLVEQRMSLGFLGTQVGEGFTRSSEAIEKGLANVTKQIELTLAPLVKDVGEHAASLTGIQSTLSTVSAYQARQEEAVARKRERWSSMKKFAVAIVTGGAAIGLKELVVLVFRHV